MDAKTFRCSCCRRIRPRNPRVKQQRYCGDKRCQRARKSKWQRKREQNDSAYRVNKKESQRVWQNKNPNYWKQYRKQHPEYCQRNKRLQHHRDRNRISKDTSLIDDLAKMDTLMECLNDTTASYLLFPANANLAKMDALSVKITPISTG